jgi:O-antigen/teichoic acid export membrane protein
VRRDAIFGFLDQTLISATNFLIGLFFVHLASKADYGLYSLGYGIIALISSFGTALITTPMTVLLGNRERSERSQFCASMLVGQLLTHVFTISIGSISVAIGWWLNWLDSEMALFAMGIGFASLGVLLQDFFRRFNYLILKPIRVFSLDLQYAVILFGLLLIAYLQQPEHMYFWAILAYGSAAGLAGALSLSGCDFRCFPKLSLIRESLSEAWQLGRWALGGVIITWLQNQSYAYFLVWFSGTTSLAEANAARLFLSPASMLSTGLMNVFMPRMARLKANNDMTGAVRMGRKILALLLLATLAYAGCVLLAQRWLISWVLTGQYGSVGPYILAWAVVIVFQAARANSSALLQIFREFRAITLANACSASLVVIMTGALIHYYGALGSIAALAFGELMMALLLWRAFARVRERVAG